MKKTFTLLFLLGICTFSFAQEKKDELKGSPSKDISAIKTANELAKYGYQQYSSSALLEAARILIATPTQNIKTEGEAPTSTVKEKPEFAPSNLLADARKYANKDANLLALIDKAEKLLNTTKRGAVGGARSGVYVVPGYSNHEFQIKFWGNELAEILASGDGDSDLDLYIYDENGNLIVYDNDYTDDCYVRWVPARTGLFTIRINNRGVANRYILATN
ncbi:hypothetical protein SDC9_62595 [bioreactor metagenome]|uniref:Peptidase C-terminal archaeal/bacterial domain-containing protein n=1 Tax=bioreactor metagenome TaxID=1076179 RepID=A0A644XKD7_9ZZZZ